MTEPNMNWVTDATSTTFFGFIQERGTFNWVLYLVFKDSFHPVLKITWEISETSVIFLDINVLNKGNFLATRCTTYG